MFTHLSAQAVKPARVVILGSEGFVGSAAMNSLKSNAVDVVAISRKQVDLCSDRTIDYLSNIFQPTDCVIIAAAKAPCKNNEILLENVIMMRNICAALQQCPVAHVIYISSDAVYVDSMEPLTELSPAAPTSLHGVMHLMREFMLESVVEKNKLLFLRPTLIFGKNDPHNGYGPNGFYRLASAGEPIKLFGNGEERRDHISISDVASIIKLCVLHKSYGILNVVTGEVVSFFEIATHVNGLCGNPAEIICMPRSGAMPHNGYRAFCNKLIFESFPKFEFKSFFAAVDSAYKTQNIVDQ